MFQRGTEREDKTMKKNINTMNMTSDELNALICNLRQVYARKQRQEMYAAKIEDLLQQAQDEGFSFVSTTTGLELKSGRVTVWDDLEHIDD